MTTETVATPTIRVDVVYALPERYWSVTLQLAVGSTVAQALAEAALERLVAGIEVDPARLAIFSRPASLTTILCDGDRLEILRPLSADPKQSRRARALESKAKKRGQN